MIFMQKVLFGRAGFRFRHSLNVVCGICRYAGGGKTKSPLWPFHLRLGLT